MLQALHIFKKDVHHLRYVIGVLLALMAIFAYLASHDQPALTQYSPRLKQLNSVFEFFILPLALWYLIAAVIHEEPLVGEQHFWLTRPYSWTSLLGAKALFILAWVNLPILIVDCVIIKAQGFQPSSYLPGLFCRQILFTIVWLLPFAALATVTENLKQFVLAGLIIPLVLFAPELLGSGTFFPAYWGGAEWIPNSAFIVLLGVATIAILLSQYFKRNTALSRAIAVSFVMLALALPLLVPRSAMYRSQVALSRPIDQSSVQITLDPTRVRPADLHSNAQPATTEIDLPLEIAGVPKGLDLTADYLTVTIESAEGKTWKGVGKTTLSQLEDGGFWMKIKMDRAAFEEMKNKSVTLHTEAYLTLLRKRGSTRVGAQAKAAVVAGLGLCSLLVSDESSGHLTCRSPFRSSYVFEKTAWVVNDSPHSPIAELTGIAEGGSYSPYPAETGISPLVATYQSEVGVSASNTIKAAIIITEDPVAHFRRDFEFHNLRFFENGAYVADAHISGPMPADGIIAGTVLDDDNHPISKAQVATFVDFPSLTESQVRAETDDHGQFLIEHLPMGNYGLTASKVDDGYVDSDQVRTQAMELTDAVKARVVLRLGRRQGVLIISVKDRITGKPILHATAKCTITTGNMTSSGLAVAVAGITRMPIPAGKNVSVEVAARGYEKWVYADSSDPSRESYLRMQSGEYKTLMVEMQPEPVGH